MANIRAETNIPNIRNEPNEYSFGTNFNILFDLVYFVTIQSLE